MRPKSPFLLLSDPKIVSGPEEVLSILRLFGRVSSHEAMASRPDKIGLYCSPTW